MQYGALPYRITDKSGLQVMLVTSRETRRWVIPKGWPINGLEPHLSAAREAYEEAGIVGRPGSDALGDYGYAKRLKDGRERPARVIVFPLAVQAQLESWPEKHQRRTKWFSVKKAAAAVAESELRTIISSLPERIAARPS